MSAEFQVQMPAAIVQLEAYYAANWAVTDWYIDGTTGSDSNTGTSAAAPLKTGRELKRRLGQCAEWDHSVTIHVLANGMIDSLVISGLVLKTGIHIDVIGTETAVISDVVAGYAARNHTAATATQVTGTAIADFSPFVWKRLRVTSGSRAGWTTWIAKANPNGVGLNVARCSIGAYIDQTSVSAPVSTTNLVAGDPFVIETLPSVPSITIDLLGATKIDGVGLEPQWPQRLFSIQSVNCEQIFVSSIANKIPHRGYIFGCRTRAILCDTISLSETASPYVSASLVAQNYGSAAGGICVIQVPGFYCLFGDGISGVYFNTGILFCTSCTFQGCFVTSNYAFSVFNSQIFDCTSTSNGALNLYGSNCFVSSISGDGNAIGLGLRNGSALKYNGTCNIKGTIAARLFGTPNIDLTAAQAMQPDDYSQKGTATLVAGSVTVTVLWYENTTQKVMVGPNTPGGTPGNWTVTQTSTTQFTITSSSALDTSTVNWFITPLGKNISINPI